jgi:hypothetical protein
MQEHDYLPPGAPGLNSRIINELEQAEDSEEEDDRLISCFEVLGVLPEAEFSVILCTCTFFNLRFCHIIGT